MKVVCIMEATAGDILVLPSSGQGHLNPCVELCKYLCPYTKSRVVLIIPFDRSSCIPSNLHPSIEVELLQVENSPPPTEGEGNRGRSLRRHRNLQLRRGILGFLSKRYNVPGKTQPGCVVLDYRNYWCKDIFLRKNVPIFLLFTSGAVYPAMKHAQWKAHANDMNPGETRLLTELPECVTLGCYSGEQGQAPGWLEDVADSKALLINTCHELEGPFLDYLANQVDKPVLGIGPLLPEAYWKSTETFCRDRDSRSLNRKSNYTEDEVIQWLDSKPSQSVIYISFGSVVAPKIKEQGQLALALRKSRRAFILVIQEDSPKPRAPPLKSGDKNRGYNPIELQQRVGKRGLIIMGWAPQLLILSHPSTGGFLSHCGWNSSMEAIGRGVPILAWPIRGDQFYNAKLVVDYLKIGAMVTSGDHDLSEMVKMNDIFKGISRLMKDKEARERAKNLSRMFEVGLPSTSEASIKAMASI